MNKDLRKVVDAAVARGGWDLARGGKHFKLRHQSGRFVSIAVSASDWRALANVQKDIERIERATA